MPIITDPSAPPVAVHRPVPVALHWEEKVKKDIDRDVALGELNSTNSSQTYGSAVCIVVSCHYHHLKPDTGHAAPGEHHIKS